MRVLVIGGTGLVGTEAARQLLAAGHDVAVLSRGRAADRLPDGIVRIHGDRRALHRHADELVHDAAGVHQLRGRGKDRDGEVQVLVRAGYDAVGQDDLADLLPLVRGERTRKTLRVT